MCPASSSIASSCGVFSYRFLFHYLFFFCLLLSFWLLNTFIKIIFRLISYVLVFVANYLHQNPSKRDEKDIKTKKIIREYMHKPSVLFAIAIFHLYPRSSPAWSVITNAKLILSYPDPKNSFRQPRNSTFHSQEPQIGILYCPRLTRVT